VQNPYLVTLSKPSTYLDESINIELSNIKHKSQVVTVKYLSTKYTVNEYSYKRYC
jgi:hypothetical protein